MNDAYKKLAGACAVGAFLIVGWAVVSEVAIGVLPVLMGLAVFFLLAGKFFGGFRRW